MDEEETTALADARSAFGEPELDEEAAPTTETPTEPDESEVEEPTTEEVSNTDEKPFDFKAYKKELREELQSDYDKKIEELKQEYEKNKPDETVTTNLEEEITKLATEKELDPEVLKGIIEIARKGTETLTADQKKTLADFESAKFDMEQKDIFETEWKNALPELKRQYPNATDEQLEKAKTQLDELSHSEKYHEMDMDYILFKETESLGKTLFSPKKATFESARPVTFDENSDEFPDFDPHMSPAQFERFEKKREAMLDTLPREKMKITSRDDGGRVVERFE